VRQAGGHHLRLTLEADREVCLVRPIIDEMAEVAAQTDREDGIPTGWEIEPNES
jgi:hypothetical protein